MCRETERKGKDGGEVYLAFCSGPQGPLSASHVLVSQISATTPDTHFQQESDLISSVCVLTGYRGLFVCWVVVL